MIHAPASLTLPHWTTVLRHAFPNVVEAKLAPAVILFVLLQTHGLTLAVIGALAFALAMTVLRLVRRQRVSILLWSALLALTVRTIAAVATGSALVYFLQPTLATSLVAIAFLVSVPIGRPLAERLTLDLLPLDDDARAHPPVRRFFRDVSLWWGVTSSINFTITLWLLLTAEPTTFLVVKSFLGPVTTAVTLGVAALWLRVLLARTGTRLVFAPRLAPT